MPTLAAAENVIFSQKTTFREGQFYKNKQTKKPTFLIIVLFFEYSHLLRPISTLNVQKLLLIFNYCPDYLPFDG